MSAGVKQVRIRYVSGRRAGLFGSDALAALLLAAGIGSVANAGVRQTAVAAAPYYMGDPASDVVSLAINVDWGEEYIPGILAVLAEHDVPATFFLTGQWCDRQPQLARRIQLSGCELGNHSYSHAAPSRLSAEEIVAEIMAAETAIRNATGYTTRLYAPPAGECAEPVAAAAASCGYATVLWSADSIDWRDQDPTVIYQRVLRRLRGGGIILAHPTAATLAALPSLITAIEAEGYTFVTVSENLGL